jgi:GntR family transcriptional regulator
MPIDPTDPRSPSKQIAAALREQIVSGELAPGAKLPTERALTAEWGVAPQTIRQALAILKNEGLIISKVGSGVFVRIAPPLIRLGAERFSRAKRTAGKAAQQSEAEAAGRTFRQEVLGLGEVEASDVVSRWLGVERGTLVFRRYRREYVDEQITHVSASHYRPEVVAGTAITQTSTGPGGSYARLEEAGHRLTRFHQEFVARMPTPDEIRLLQLPSGTPVMDVLRVAYSEDGPIEVYTAVVNASMIVFTEDFDAPE